MARLLIVAVASKAPAWAQAACAEYLKRMPRGFDTALETVRPEPRSTGKPLERLLALEAARIRERLPRGARLVALDERGRELGSAQFAAQLRRWIDDGPTTAFAIGGPDGLDPALRRDAALQLRLSAFTLPHALAQVVLCEQLYRAASLLGGHPYHRA
ncbi:MAG TPA: 23S rRNA (pseudouridine(1915)-N(3))-methyltransferase RlmH [Burkholderiales bacterium]|nr:23S rRNA (pseudouridine(1915)-N(3))-methyltransferase RlmH [Burkholderiales bacterium]